MSPKGRPEQARDKRTGGRHRATYLYRWGACVARHWQLALATTLLVSIFGGMAYPYLRSHLIGLDWEADHSESSQVDAFIQQNFPGQGVEQDLLVFDSGENDITILAADVNGVVNLIRDDFGVTSVVGPFDAGGQGQIAPNRHVAFAIVGLSGDPSTRATSAQRLEQRAVSNSGPRLDAWLTGLSPIFNDQLKVEEASATRGESIGIALALVVLVLALGSLAAALVPLLVTASSLAVTFGLLALASAVVSFDSFVLSCVTMIGTGIAIDYSLFIVSRFREELAGRHDFPDRKLASATAVATAIATSGRTILIAGTVVGVSLCSLFVIRAPVYREISIAIGTTVICTLASAMTLLPAILSALGEHINLLSLPERWQPGELRTRITDSPRGWARWAEWVMRHPLLLGTMSSLILLAAAWPLGSLKYGLDLDIRALHTTSSGRGASALFSSFYPGILSPIQITASGPSGKPLDTVEHYELTSLIDDLKKDPDTAAVDVLQSGGYVLITAMPVTAADVPPTTRIVNRIRAEIAANSMPDGPEMSVGGATAKFIDLGDTTRAGTPPVLSLVLGASLLLLLVMFRSVVLAVKAVAMNLLTTAASIGLTVAVFQWGWFASNLGFTSLGYLQLYMPITIFAVIFGLSMDYHVFLIRRMREEWLQNGDNTRAVVAGITHTARPITSAATIMVCVFGSFISSDVLEMKELGFGLATAIAIDAALVRLVLVPSLMRMLGRLNWWFPGFGLRPERWFRAGSSSDTRVGVV